MHGYRQCCAGKPGKRKRRRKEVSYTTGGDAESRGALSSTRFAGRLGTEGPDLFSDGPRILKWTWPEKLKIGFANNTGFPAV